MSIQISQNPQLNIPNNSYKIDDNSGKLEHGAKDHILKNKPFMGARDTAQKLINDVEYAKMGLKGSPNSNFYQFMSLGLIPNIIGCATMIATFGAANGLFNLKDKSFANRGKNTILASVLMYALGKWIGNKIINKGVKYTTGIDQDQKLLRNVAQLPEEKGDRNRVRKEIHGTYESVKWYGRNEMYAKGDEEENNRYAELDKLSEKMGYDKPLNAPDQIVFPKLEKVLGKSKAAKYVSSYIWAALGVAIASKASFSKFGNYANHTKFGYKVKDFGRQLFKTFKTAAKDVWMGTRTVSSKEVIKEGFASKAMGRGLVIAAVASSVLGIINANIGYRVKNHGQKPTTVDYKQEFTES